MIYRKDDDYAIRNATADDIQSVISFYDKLHPEQDEDDQATTHYEFIKALDSERYEWIIAVTNTNQVVASIFFIINKRHRVAKITLPLIDPALEDSHLMQNLVNLGTQELLYKSHRIDSIYTTMRTSQHKWPKMMEFLGYKCFGILPNAACLKAFETHLIWLKNVESSWSSRIDPSTLLAPLQTLYKLSVINNRVLAKWPKRFDYPKKSKPLTSISKSETSFMFTIDFDPEGVWNEFHQMVKNKHLKEYSSLFFMEYPNVRLVSSTNPDLKIYFSYNQAEKRAHLVYLDPNNPQYEHILDEATNLLHYEYDIRSFELDLSANDIDLCQQAINCRFIPSGYCPGFLMDFENQRHDMVTFMKSYDLVDFNAIKLENNAQHYLSSYYHLWQQIQVDIPFNTYRDNPIAQTE